MKCSSRTKSKSYQKKIIFQMSWSTMEKQKSHFNDSETDIDDDFDYSTDGNYDYDCYDEFSFTKEKKKKSYNDNYKAKHFTCHEISTIDDNYNSKRVFIKHIKEKCVCKKNLCKTKQRINYIWNCKFQYRNHKNNIEKKLIKQGLRRLETYAMPECSAAFLTYSKRRNTSSDPEKNSKFAVNSVELFNFDLEKRQLEILMNLQYREVTPEDYEFLLQLDNFVEPNVASRAEISKLTAFDLADEPALNDVCVICMEEMLRQQQITKLLKCDHSFHYSCIIHWLENSSNTCPIDNLVV